MRTALHHRRLVSLALAAAVLAGCGAPAAAPLATQSAAPAPLDDGATLVTPDAESPETGPEITAGAVQDADALAGVLNTEVLEVGDGTMTTVPGTAPAPPASRTYDVAIQVEGGLSVDTDAFATFVMATLNDPRGWPSSGYGFGRVDDAAAADVIVVLASPQTSADLCRPLVTGGRLSCREGRRAILTSYRWVNGQDDYGDDRTGYRQYVVNHEVGHFLGRGHKSCPGAGRPAPVMMQQTKGVGACTPNPWPSVAP